MVATKEQERKALEQIKNILDSIGGASSYIGIALNGMLEDAAENIENDFGLSWKDRAETADKLRKQAEDITADTLKAMDKAKTDLQHTQQQLDDYMNDAATQAAEIDKLREEARQAEQAANENGAALTAAQAEILRLKAMLFDYMTK